MRERGHLLDIPMEELLDADGNIKEKYRVKDNGELPEGEQIGEEKEEEIESQEESSPSLKKRKVEEEDPCPYIFAAGATGPLGPNKHLQSVRVVRAHQQSIDLVTGRLSLHGLIFLLSR